MKKSLKVLTVLLLVVAMMFTLSTRSFAAASVNASSIMSGINGDAEGVETAGMQTIASRVLGLLQIISAILAVVIIAWLGFKMLLGSAGEKADVQKQFIPLIIGCVIVFAATSIAKLLLGIMGVA